MNLDVLSKEIHEWLTKMGRQSFADIRFKFKEKALSNEIKDILNNAVLFKAIETKDAIEYIAISELSPKKVSKPKKISQRHPLQDAFDAAILQATKGKGVRHGGDSIPFMGQPWYKLAQDFGVQGLLFQCAKKAGESLTKETEEDFERELLGAIVYAGMAYLYVKENGFKREKQQ